MDANAVQTSENIVAPRTLTLWQLISFGVLTTPLAMGGLALVLFIPTFYAVEMGLGLTAVGIIFALGRVLDVFTDPLIGNLSDETRSKWGPRRPWIVLGTPFYCIAVWLLLAPPEGVGLLYLVAVSGLYFLLYTVVDVPYSSIGLEISPHIHERSFLASSKAVFQVIGALAAASIPLAFALSTGASLRFIAQVIVVLSIIGLASFLIFMPSHNRPVSAQRINFWQASKQVLKIAPYRKLIIAFFIVQTANALTGGLTVLYITHVIGQPKLVGAFLGVLFLTTALFLPVWVFLSQKANKKTSWMISILICCVVLVGGLLLEPNSIIGAGILCVVLGACFGCDAIMPTSMLADIVYQCEQEGKNRFAGVSLAVKNAVSKLTFVVPMGLAFPVLDLVGFNERGSNGADQLFTLTIFFAGLPILLRLIAFVVLQRSAELPIAQPHQDNAQVPLK